MGHRWATYCRFVAEWTDLARFVEVMTDHHRQIFHLISPWITLHNNLRKISLSSNNEIPYRRALKRWFFFSGVEVEQWSKKYFAKIEYHITQICIVDKNLSFNLHLFRRVRWEFAKVPTRIPHRLSNTRNWSIFRYLNRHQRHWPGGKNRSSCLQSEEFRK